MYIYIYITQVPQRGVTGQIALFRLGDWLWLQIKKLLKFVI